MLLRGPSRYEAEVLFSWLEQAQKFQQGSYHQSLEKQLARKPCLGVSAALAESGCKSGHGRERGAIGIRGCRARLR
jgi:hypothetical protein